MSDTKRWDPEMLAARARMLAEAAKHPPVVPQPPFDVARESAEKIGQLFGSGGPQMAHSEDRWVFARGRRIFARFHHPAPSEHRPLLVWFHGGGWVSSSVDTHDRLVRELATAAGFAALNVDYALSPEARFPQAVLDCAEVVRKVAAAAPDWDIDASRIVVGGDSVGGNLAAAVAIALRDEGGPALTGMHLICPVVDANFETPSYHEFAEGYGLSRTVMMACWDLYTPEPDDRQNPLAAPLRDHCAGLPSALVQLAELDILCSEGDMMAAKINAAGGQAVVKTYRGMVHGFIRCTDAVQLAREAVADAGSWMKMIARQPK